MLRTVTILLAGSVLTASIDHSGVRLALVVLLVLFGFAAGAVHLHNWADSWIAARRRRARFFLLAFLPVAGGCRDLPPTVAPAEVTALDCGGRSCLMTEAGGVTLITVQE